MNAVLRHWNNFTLRLAQAPYWPLALLARFSLAALFWRSGQTKISGFAVDPLDGTWQWGWPQLSDSTIYLFAEEYRLPLLAPEPAALLAALMEHLLALMLLLGIGSRIAAIDGHHPALCLSRCLSHPWPLGCRPACAHRQGTWFGIG